MSTCNTPDARPCVALIAGPTASGKSARAIGLAKELEKQGRSARVINADSMQVYADLHVLSARPRAEEMEGIVHVLFGEWDGARACSAADWAQRARQEIERAHQDKAVAILVGGTGLYLQVLLEGIAPIPPIDPDIRAQVRSLPSAQAFAALSSEDLDAAQKLKPGDSQRVARALEIVRSTGQPLSVWQQQKTGGIAKDIALHPLIVLPDRRALYEACDTRFAHMFDNGALAEVERLLARNLAPDLPVMRAIGVREIAAFLRGEMPREEALADGARATRHYAKRQYTWFRNQPPPEWPRSAMDKTSNNAYFDRLLHK